jgi:transcriptional regulator with XRE-family HTH domain
MAAARSVSARSSTALFLYPLNMPENIKTAIANRLALARENAGLSQGQVARMLNMHRPSISEVEAGRRSVTAEELSKFAEVYGVDMDWLGCRGESEPELDKDRIHLAARELAKLKKDDLDKVIDLLSALRKGKSKS